MEINVCDAMARQMIVAGVFLGFLAMKNESQFHCTCDTLFSELRPPLRNWQLVMDVISLGVYVLSICVSLLSWLLFGAHVTCDASLACCCCCLIGQQQQMTHQYTTPPIASINVHPNTMLAMLKPLVGRLWAQLISGDHHY